MPPPPTLKICEIFPSVQGEGLRMGLPALFVRLSGCNLRCDFCDTQYAWEGGDTISQDEILNSLHSLRRDFPAEWICLTGGEPFFQDIFPFTSMLKKDGYKVQIESNGTLYRPAEWDWLTLSPKPPDYFIRPEWVEETNEAKLVVHRSLDLEHVRLVRKALPLRTPVLLQPQSRQRWSEEKAWALMQESVKTGMKNIRLTVQLHKILRLR